MNHTRFGPEREGDLTRFRLYAPDTAAVGLEIDGAATVAMQKAGHGFFAAALPGLAPGARYRFRIGDGEAAVAVPDPASHGQAEDADGWSLVPAPLAPVPASPRRPWHEAIIAEVHVGTATPEGTFRALIDRLDHYRDAGFTVIELMPVADFAGRRNWGYDGVLLYAPDTAYGTPQDLRALVEAAHERGLGMMLDVVYNHFGPSGNYLPLYARSFFREDVDTPWGPAIDLENEAVRAFFTENAAYWLSEFGFDGLRFDAVHALATKGAETFLREMAAACRAVRPDAWLVLENHDNIAGWMTRDEQLYTAQWNDDWHHAFHVLASGERTGYYAPYARDPVAAAGRALAEGFVFQGDPYPDADGDPRGTPCTQLAPDAFVAFAQNHDHIGNRPLGDRLAATLAPERLAFLRFVLMLSPAIPLLFQGEEALLTQPFPFFCDFDGELAEAVRKGRRSEFADFFDAHGASFPDPLSEATFISAKLQAEDMRTPQARAELDAFSRLTEQRRKLVWPLAASGFLGSEHRRTEDALRIAWHFDAGTLVMVLNAGGRPVTIDPLTGFAGMPAGASLGGVLHEAGGNLTLDPFAAAVWSLAAA
ncbi:malto-oligosyltrehalose trehalohydrolase [Ancylobacter dichloromethanicus]|uniref:Malto-oligosyltrehalose trehalohydrolase n=2 Tax=Ancylobacter dichloromethanicus TaxID=518825 RepID=A0A9W6N004_9HYPH|nr:malto-oligosyltrehalose trehalohydrolase [Ancylobacter dichloromethanicus]MBS7555136.1 malto-oligosyltrehalose trehalohydrolase [Ancylobacter dichloromethanicus]GLK72507.1 malto-oligosyltrehalose trehalohydrolase [Ancylobacter dichloromethanicus]